MSTTTPASTRPRGRHHRRRGVALVAAVALLVGVAAACEPDTAPPLWFEGQMNDPGFHVSALGPHLAISWPSIADATSYRIDANGATATVQTGTTPACVLVGLTANTTYAIEVTAYDAAGNWSGTVPNLRARPSRLTATRTTPAGPNGGPTLRCVSTTDTDGDRLPDVLETGTGTWAHSASTGSSPTVVDSDEDGLHDGDEVLGTPTGLNLHALGARPQRRDLIVEVDWLTDVTAPARTPCSSVSDLRMSAATVQIATAAMAAFPVSTPLGGSGINLIVDRGQGGAFTGGTGVPDADGRYTAYEGKYYEMAPERLGYVHYAMSAVDFLANFVGYITGGSAPKPGSHLNIGNGCGAGLTDFQVAAVLVHELGHNIDLGHGGHDHVNDKHNYQSLMNYRYAYAADVNCDGVGDPLPTPQLRWSGEVLAPIDETAVRETRGICANGTDVDFNGNGSIQTSTYQDDINDDDEITVLEGSDDGEHASLASSFRHDRLGGSTGEEIADPLP